MSNLLGESFGNNIVLQVVIIVAVCVVVCAVLAYFLFFHKKVKEKLAVKKAEKEKLEMERQEHLAKENSMVGNVFANRMQSSNNEVKSKNDTVEKASGILQNSYSYKNTTVPYSKLEKERQNTAEVADKASKILNNEYASGGSYGGRNMKGQDVVHNTSDSESHAEAIASNKLSTASTGLSKEELELAKKTKNSGIQSNEAEDILTNKYATGSTGLTAEQLAEAKKNKTGEGDEANKTVSTLVNNEYVSVNKGLDEDNK